MLVRWGAPVVVVASLLVTAAPAFAQETATETTTPGATMASTTTDLSTTDDAATTTDVSTTTDAPTTTEVPTTTDAPTTTEVSTTTVANGALLEEPASVTGPATASRTPMRGTQVQLAPPPPPPDDPFVPPVDGLSGRRVVYSKTKQTVWVYDESNTIIKMHRVSGRQDPRDPSPGVYRVWSRSMHTFAIHNPSITWNYMIRFAKGDRDGNIGFHDIPYQYGRPVQTTDQLGQALSGGCVRQAPEDAIWMWNWAGIGTVVVVTP